jgi:hypothetical protein
MTPLLCSRHCHPINSYYKPISKDGKELLQSSNTRTTTRHHHWHHQPGMWILHLYSPQFSSASRNEIQSLYNVAGLGMCGVQSRTFNASGLCSFQLLLRFNLNLLDDCSPLYLYEYISMLDMKMRRNRVLPSRPIAGTTKSIY